MRRAWAKFLFSFFSSKLAEMFLRSTAIACNVPMLKEVAVLKHKIMNEEVQFDNRKMFERSGEPAISFKHLLCCRFPFHFLCGGKFIHFIHKLKLKTNVTTN